MMNGNAVADLLESLSRCPTANHSVSGSTHTHYTTVAETLRPLGDQLAAVILSSKFEERLGDALNRICAHPHEGPRACGTRDQVELEQYLQALMAITDPGRLVSDPPGLPLPGIRIGGKLYTPDTLRRCELAIGLKLSEVDATLSGRERGAIVVEVGGGWGGSIWTLHHLYPGTRYVLIDHPAVLATAAYCLSRVLPSLVITVGDHQPSTVPASEGDVILVPYQCLDHLQILDPDLLLDTNGVLFQSNYSLSDAIMSKISSRYIYSILLNSEELRHQCVRDNRYLWFHFTLPFINTHQPTQIKYRHIFAWRLIRG